MYVTDELHLRPMQGRRKRHFRAGWRSRGPRIGGGCWLQDSMYQVSQPPNITEERQPTPQFWTPEWLQASLLWLSQNMMVQSREPVSSRSALGWVWTSEDIRILLLSCNRWRFSSSFHLDWVRWLLFTLSLLCPDWVCPFERGKVRKLWKIIMGLSKYSDGESVTWGYFGSFRARRQRQAAAWAPACFLQLLLAKPRRHLKRGQVVEVEWDISSGICGYVISG